MIVDWTVGEVHDPEPAEVWYVVSMEEETLHCRGEEDGGRETAVGWIPPPLPMPTLAVPEIAPAPLLTVMVKFPPPVRLPAS